jgi:hypothetical protein
MIAYEDIPKDERKKLLKAVDPQARGAVEKLKAKNDRTAINQ